MGFVRIAVVVGGALAAIWLEDEARKQEAESRRERKLPNHQIALLIGSALVAVGAGIWLAVGIGGLWWALPLALWAIVLSSAFSGARRQQRKRLAQQVRLEEMQRQYEREAKARSKADRKARISELGRQGANLLDQAESALQHISGTEAATTGWLGDPAELDFTADLEMITTNLRSAAQLRRVAEELRDLPKPNADDRAILKEVDGRAHSLTVKAEGRVKLLMECARRAGQIDASLHDEREKTRIAEKREDLHGRVTALLYRAELAPKAAPSKSADKVIALVSAYKEIKDEIESGRRNEELVSGVSANEQPEKPIRSGMLASASRIWDQPFKLSLNPRRSKAAVPRKPDFKT